MADYQGLRPVSGEIVTSSAVRGRASAGGMAAAGADIVEAEYEILGRTDEGVFAAPPSRTVFPPSLTSDMPAAGMNVLRRAEGRPPAGEASRSGLAFWLAGMIVVAAAFWASGGHALFDRPSRIPPVAQAHPVLHVAEVSSRVQTAQGRQWLLVEGEVVNTGGAASGNPPVLVFMVNGKDGKTRRHVLGTGTAGIAPGERLTFASRLEAPLAGVASLSVTVQEGKAE